MTAEGFRPSVERGVSFPGFTATAGSLIAHCVAHHPDMVLSVLGDRRMSYREAEVRSRRIAKGLIASGLGKGSRVGLLAPNGPDWIVGWLAASRIGCVVALLNTYDKAREQARNLRLADVDTVLTVGSHLGHDYLARFEDIAPGLDIQTPGRFRIPELPFLRSVHVFGVTDRRWAGSVEDLEASGAEVSDELFDRIEEQVTPADHMVIVFSSGSTTDPKGAVHSHGTVIRHAHNLWQFRDLKAGDVVYSPMPLFWVGGLSYTLMAVMHAGATHLSEPFFEPGATLDLLERERATHALGWPHVGKALVEHPSFPQRDLSSIRAGSLEALLPAAKRRVDPSRRANSLGMTETMGPHSAEAEGTELPPDKVGSFGRAVPGVEHRVVDPETGLDTAPGELGEIWVRGYSVMQQLYKREREDVFTVDGWYRTGDGGWLDADGHLFYKGRLGEQIKSSGMNITPREVEIVLEEMDEVMLAFVMGVPHAVRGEDVAAVLVPRPGLTIDIDDLTGRLRSQIASYKVPRHVTVVDDQRQLPWLDSGKVDRRALQRSVVERFSD